MQVIISYSDEGFEFKATEKPDGIEMGEYYNYLTALVAYGMVALSARRGEGDKRQAKMILEHALNDTRRMLEDDTVFSAIVGGMHDGTEDD